MFDARFFHSIVTSPKKPEHGIKGTEKNVEPMCVLVLHSSIIQCKSRRVGWGEEYLII